ncbi:MAG: hypothetical protein OHK0057_16000 [Thermoflexibacter sp.]
MKILLYFSIAILVIACNPSHEAIKTTSIPNSFLTNSTRTKSYRITRYDKIANIDHAKPNGSHLEPPSEAFNYFKFDNHWEDAHAKVLKYLKKNENYSLHLQEQMIACTMLDEYLLKVDKHPELAETVLFYLDLLIKNDNTEVLLMSKSLQKVSDFLNESQFNTYKRKIKDKALYVLKQSDIEDGEKEQIKNTVF